MEIAMRGTSHTSIPVPMIMLSFNDRQFTIAEKRNFPLAARLTSQAPQQRELPTAYSSSWLSAILCRLRSWIIRTPWRPVSKRPFHRANQIRSVAAFAQRHPFDVGREFLLDPFR